MINLADHIIEIEGKKYVPLEIAQEAIINTTDAISKIAAGYSGLSQLKEEIDND